MKQGKRMRDTWEWVAPQNRASKFGGGKLDHPKVENRIPKFIIDSLGVENEVYFVNNSKETLRQVISSRTSGWPKNEEDIKFCYLDVLPGEMVKIDDFDPIYDYKEVIQQDVCIESENRERVRFYCTSYGDIISQTVLLWDDNTSACGTKVEL